MFDHPERYEEQEAPYEGQPREHLSFVGAYHGEGPVRLDRLFRQVRPWVGTMVIALQAPTEQEVAVASTYANVVLIHPKLGFCEASFWDIENTLRTQYENVRWVFSMDGDELADQQLLASLSTMANFADIRWGKDRTGWRILKRTTLGLSDGTVVPGITEANLRFYDVACTRPPKPHAWIEGIDREPEVWNLGAIREHRTMEEYLNDQTRYASLDGDAVPITRALLNRTFRHLRQFLSEAAVHEEFYKAGLDYEDWIDD